MGTNKILKISKTDPPSRHRNTMKSTISGRGKAKTTCSQARRTEDTTSILVAKIQTADSIKITMT